MNKVKEFIKREWTMILIILVNFGIGIFYYPILPDKVPMHWNVYGNVDRYGSKWELILLIPCLILIIYFLMITLPLIDPKKRNYDLFEGPYKLMRMLFLLFFTGVFIFVIAASLGYSIRVDKVIPIAVSILFLVLGNYMGKIKQNYFVGIKTPWTLNNNLVWNKTHRFGGWVWVIGSIVMLLASIFLTGILLFSIFISAVAVMAIAPIVYSYIIYKK